MLSLFLSIVSVLILLLDFYVGPNSNGPVVCPCGLSCFCPHTHLLSSWLLKDFISHEAFLSYICVSGLVRFPWRCVKTGEQGKGTWRDCFAIDLLRLFQCSQEMRKIIIQLLTKTSWQIYIAAPLLFHCDCTYRIGLI